jgi:hypothetical protein
MTHSFEGHRVAYLPLLKPDCPLGLDVELTCESSSREMPFLGLGKKGAAVEHFTACFGLRQLLLDSSLNSRGWEVRKHSLLQSAESFQEGILDRRIWPVFHRVEPYKSGIVRSRDSQDLLLSCGQKRVHGALQHYQRLGRTAPP